MSTLSGNLRTLDTPHKLPSTIRHSSMLREKDTAQELANAVLADLSRNFRVCDTTEFLRKNLPVPTELVDHILATLTKSGVYDRRARDWKGMPKSQLAAEDRHYDPFCLVANGIQNIVEDYIAKRDMPRTTTKGIWLNRANKTPESPNKDSAWVRPDVVNVTITHAINALDDIIAKEEVEGSGQAQQAVNLSVWWRQIHHPVEYKRKASPEDYNLAVNQLCHYLRMILREQVDRRFAMGLVVCFNQLTVLLNDRSGLFGTSGKIDIHKNPRDFIHVIAAFAFLDPKSVGWDPSMKVYDPERDISVPSYEIGNKPKIFGKSSYSTHWEIDVPSKDGKSREKVITVRTLSVVGAEVMCGRASVVWEVVRWFERFNPSETYVLKRYWRPYTTMLPSPPACSLQSSDVQIPGQMFVEGLHDIAHRDAGPLPAEDSSAGNISEGDLYKLFDSFELRLYSYEDITIDGVVDSTLEGICHGVLPEPLHTDNSTPLLGKKFVFFESKERGSNKCKDRDEKDEDAEPFLHRNSTLTMTESHLVVANNSGAQEPISRAHAQILLPNPGWVIRNFRSLKELLLTLLGAVKDHQNFYNKGGLHRDVSSGNIIIVPLNGDVEMTEGRLIDLDHAKRTKNFTMHNLPAASEVFIQVTRTLLANDDLSVEEDVLLDAASYHKNGALDYLGEVIETRVTYFGLSRGKRYSRADLKWNYETPPRPSFGQRIAGNSGTRTGTYPYMSAEVLSNKLHQIYITGKRARRFFYHDAVHDMESFLWVLVEICLTRKGPGLGMRRDELKPGESMQSSLADCVHKLFDADVGILSDVKSELLENPDGMDDNIVPLFHPYFEQLKPMVLQWWHTLWLAYRYRAIEYLHIHNHVIDILEETISKLSHDDDSENSRKEVDRRKRECQLVREMLRKKNQAAKTVEAFDTSPEVQDLGHKQPLIAPPDSPTRPKKKSRKTLLKN